MYSVKVLARDEVRMGSPYAYATVEIEGGYVPLKLNDQALTDVFLVDDRDLYFACWAIQQQKAGFFILKISDEMKTCFVSKRFEGCAEKIEKSPTGDSLIVHAWQIERGNYSVEVSEFRPEAPEYS